MPPGHPTPHPRILAPDGLATRTPPGNSRVLRPALSIRPPAPNRTWATPGPGRRRRVAWSPLFK